MTPHRENHSLPERIKLKDFSGLPFTLNNLSSAWKELTASENIDRDLILLGIAPGHLEKLPFVQDALERNRKVYWLEAPETLHQLAINKASLPPSNPSWIQIGPEFLQSSALDKRIIFYEPGRRLAPDFWGQIIAALAVNKYKTGDCASKTPIPSLAWLPGNENQLLHVELHEALKKNGMSRIVSDIPLTPNLQSLEKIWQEQIPEFILSINFRGLDSHGQVFEICKALNIPLAIWLVDNPWHLLSGIRLPWWKRANIFVSDADFVTNLQNSGAQHVEYCPLATAPHMWRQIIRTDQHAPLFIGRSTFPGQKEFFGRMSVDTELAREVKAFLEAKGYYPDYHWWTAKFPEKPWPGKGGRKAGFYADYYSARNRARWLKKAMAADIRIIGDDGWKEIIPECKIEKQVDYYGTLPDIYQNSGAVLNVTSLLLPASLNQRHFDVWAAGSLLLTDISKGLDIFPQELTSLIKLNQPEDFPSKYDFLQKHQRLSADLIMAWQEELKARHTYAHRIEFMRRQVSQVQD